MDNIKQFQGFYSKKLKYKPRGKCTDCTRQIKGVRLSDVSPIGS